MNEKFLFNDVAKEYINYTARIKSSTFYTYTSLYDKHIKNFARGLFINEISKRTIRSLQQQMIEKRKINGKPYSSKTVNTVTALFNSIIAYAVEYEYIQENPCSGFKKLRIKKQSEICFWDDKEFLKAIEKEKSYMWKVLFTLTYMTGMRKGEVRGLKWTDINFERKTLTIRRHISDNDMKDRGAYGIGNVIEGRKNSEEDLVLALAELELQMLMQWKETEMQVEGWSDDWFIFGERKPITKNLPNTHLDRIAYAAGIKRIKFHGLRHSHVSFLIDKGLSVYEIAERIGDKVEMVLNVYGHLFPNPQLKIVQVLNRGFSSIDLFM